MTAIPCQSLPDPCLSFTIIIYYVVVTNYLSTCCWCPYGPGHGRGRQSPRTDTLRGRTGDTNNRKDEYLLTDLAEVFPPGGVGDDAEHELAHVEGVSPVVVGHAAVVTPHRAQPPAAREPG